jgi:hypothetical protein
VLGRALRLRESRQVLWRLIQEEKGVDVALAVAIVGSSGADVLDRHVVLAGHQGIVLGHLPATDQRPDRGAVAGKACILGAAVISGGIDVPLDQDGVCLRLDGSHERRPAL